MTEQEKQLLLEDLCARLPYGVRTCTYIPHIEGGGETIERTLDSITIDELHGSSLYPNEKPYLRPMSSMTEEERNEYNNIYQCRCHEKSAIRLTTLCYSHHLDINGLIEKGLALEAPEGMYC